MRECSKIGCGDGYTILNILQPPKFTLQMGESYPIKLLFFLNGFIDPKDGQSPGIPSSRGFQSSFLQPKWDLAALVPLAQPFSERTCPHPEWLEAQVKDMNPKNVGLTAARRGDCKYRSCRRFSLYAAALGG